MTMKAYATQAISRKKSSVAIGATVARAIQDGLLRMGWTYEAAMIEKRRQLYRRRPRRLGSAAKLLGRPIRLGPNLSDPNVVALAISILDASIAVCGGLHRNLADPRAPLQAAVIQFDQIRQNCLL
jgi:hypothetical protein